MAQWHDERPHYLRVAADLRAKIMSGDLTGQLPIVKDLMMQYGVPSNSVIQQAVKTLKDEGLVTTRQGKGSFVVTDRITLIDATPGINLGTGEEKSKYRLLRVGQAVPPADAAKALKIEPGEPAVLREQVLVRPDGVPVELVWNYYRPEDAVETVLVEDRKITGGAKAYFASVGRTQEAMDDSITTRPPTTDETVALELPASALVLRTVRTITDQNGEPMEVSVIVKGGHLFGLRHHRSLR